LSGLEYSKGGSGSKRLGLLLLFPFIILLLSYLVYKLFFIPAPVVEGTQAFAALPEEKTIILKGKNLKSIDIFVRQGLKSIELLHDTPEERDLIYKIKIKPKTLGLVDGKAKVIIKAKSGLVKRAEYEIDTMIDTVPPSLSLLNSPYKVYQGTAGFAKLRAEGADSVYIKIEDYIFRAYQAESGVDDGFSSVYLAFFAAPLDVDRKSVFYAVAEDAVGNKAVRALRTRLREKTYKKSTITINDSFIERMIYPLLGVFDDTDPVGAFRKVNEDWRRDSIMKLKEIGRESEPRRLWDGRFLQLKNSRVMATYGDRRTYLYKGTPISESVHLGYDLASLKTAPVQAANSGIVKFSGDLGIYGNTVIIDHGLGLMSLYAHLSFILVKEGQMVNRGEIIGNTGSTGLAGGDHLHFGILVHGMEVSPLEWWDPHWVKVNVLEKMK
jgi:hypothetical protein